MSDLPRVVETALACLHKLVAYSYLQDESTRSGRLNDQTTVAQARPCAQRDPAVRPEVLMCSFLVCRPRNCKVLCPWRNRCTLQSTPFSEDGVTELSCRHVQ